MAVRPNESLSIAVESAHSTSNNIATEEPQVPLVSSPESVRQGRLSALALVETIVASGFSFWFAWKQNTVEHIVIASAIAPFLLLRTRLSTEYIVSTIEKIEDKTPLWAILLLLPVKIFCSIKSFLNYPLQSISVIPVNFYKYVFAVDLVASPQSIPGADEIDSRLESWVKTPGFIYQINNTYNILNVLSRMREGLRKRFVILIARTYFGGKPNSLFLLYIRMTIIVYGFLTILIIAALPMILIAFSFRFAIKSTAIIWLPLLWIIRQSRPGTSIFDRIKLNVRQPWSKLMLIYSLFVLAGFAAKVLLVFGAWKFAQLDWLGPVGELIIRLVEPLYLPLWQITSALNALISWGFYFRAERHLLARNSTEAWPEAWVRREYVAFQAVRTTLSLYAIACTFYLAAATAWQAEWPPIRLILFPWSSTPQ
jgi:hypothetical protein